MMLPLETSPKGEGAKTLRQFVVRRYESSLVDVDFQLKILKTFCKLLFNIG